MGEIISSHQKFTRHKLALLKELGFLQDWLDGTDYVGICSIHLVLEICKTLCHIIILIINYKTQKIFDELI